VAALVRTMHILSSMFKEHMENLSPATWTAIDSNPKLNNWNNDSKLSTLKDATGLEPGLVEFDRLTWLDTEEAATYLRKTANALRIMVYRGYIRPKKFRRRLYFRKVELDRLLESSPF
jgi:hypothetical protein